MDHIPHRKCIHQLTIDDDDDDVVKMVCQLDV